MTRIPDPNQVLVVVAVFAFIPWLRADGKIMKAEIHPEYNEIKATCSCGNIIVTRSTLSEDIHVDVCSSCHPFYTGKQKMLDSGGRVEKFRKRFGSRSAGS